jgi:hypothetical protein
VTARPDDAEAVGFTKNVPPEDHVRVVVVWALKVIVCGPWVMVTACETGRAAFQLPLPAWLATIVQVPTFSMVTFVPLIEQTDAEAGAGA